MTFLFVAILLVVPPPDKDPVLPSPGSGKGRGDWIQWRGPNRDGVSTDTGLLKKWPEKGPKLLWETKGAGRGYASIAIGSG